MKKRKLSANSCSEKSSDCKWFHEDIAAMMERVAAPPKDGDTSLGRVESRADDGGSNLIGSESSCRMYKVPKYLHQGFIDNCSNWLTRGRTTRRLSSFTNLLVLCVFVLTLSLSVQHVHGDQLQPETHMPSSNDTGVCQSMDIRNHPNQLERLKDCRVIEGFLQILLIDRVRGSDKAFENYTFPKLTEITNYLMLYRVNGLKTLRKLFPNLAVIRGNQLFVNYALIVYELMDIEEIGLISLTHIGRGAVRIQNNPSLCYVHTIDWTAIATHTVKADHYIKGNNKENLCPMCPGSKRGEREGDQESPKSTLECPRKEPFHRLCWNSENCQKTCPDMCRNHYNSLSCSNEGTCCDPSCLGGCHKSHPESCIVCRYFSLGYGKDRKCVEKCPNGYYTHMNRRCISKQECLNVTKSLDVRDVSKMYPYIPFNGTCTLECPTNYYKMDNDTNNRTCIPCNGLCRKTCQAAKIDSISTAQQMRGCTHIAGSLEIQIMNQGGLNIVKELEEFLSNIEEIDGYLKVARSFPLMSLSFLKNLKVIHGKTLEYNRNSLIVLDNPNLQSLWNTTNHLKIERGRISFHYNPKLCLYKIEKLKTSLPITGRDFYDEQDVAKTSNGDKIACNVTRLIVNTTKIEDNGAVIEWEPFQLEDDRALLGYVVSYIEAPFKNVSLYDGRDACGSDGWKVDDVGRDSGRQSSISYLLPRLEPYTQYAYYVKTYTVATEKMGAQSDIIYFRTRPGRPEQVQRLRTTANGTSEIVVEWEPPSKARGNLTSYCILATISQDSAALRSKRNYCTHGLKPESDLAVPQLPPQKPTSPTTSDDPEKCACTKNEKPKLSEADAEIQISFEDHLHNYVYIKKTGSRTRRSAAFNGNNSLTLPGDIGLFPEVLFPENKETEDTGIPEEKKKDVMDDNHEYFIQIYRELNVTETKYVIKQLKHYTQYIISVMACREIENAYTDSEKETPNCSTKAIVHQRTGKIGGADDVTNVAIDKSNNNTLFISWKPPRNPNSLVLTYTVRIQKVDDVNSMRKAVEHCIQKEDFDKSNGTFKLTMLEPGNYSIQVMATSLAGDGNATEPHYVTIDKETNNTTMYILVTIIPISLCILGVAVWLYYKRNMRNVPDLKLIATVNPDYVSMQYTPDEWEMPRENITQQRELGQGSFGMVYEGTISKLEKYGENVKCAIKTVNENATDRERMNFLKEASVMKAFDTHHVVRLLGVVSRGQPTLVIMELMAKGDLKGYLRSHRPDPEAIKTGQSPPQPPTLKRILQMAIEIADGMAYLAAKKFVHRDLAARNCMVAEDLTVKIGDFGMTRDIYETDYYRKGTKGLLPVRWMSPESLKDGVFTSSSDVFSYGVVLWEMATLASQPYQGLSNDQVLRYVIDGGVMERPENCPDKLYHLMRDCWQHKPNLRPSFMEIVSGLLEDAHVNFTKVSFYHSDEGVEVRLQLESASQALAENRSDDVTTLLRRDEEALSIDDDHDTDENFLMERPRSHQLITSASSYPKKKQQHSPLR
ncbi:insulin-like receptor isoform X2 [Phlebotomus argentipes]|uniref:insulin-like receptor isoform X2 n=1 Tax=Phlebotomus argentipes TaxID=94469 RepID=UPI002892F07C|nr:insulin-like receptor isoform X2 [Phlebotomus argentipes]